MKQKPLFVGFELGILVLLSLILIPKDDAANAVNSYFNATAFVGGVSFEQIDDIEVPYIPVAEDRKCRDFQSDKLELGDTDKNTNGEVSQLQKFLKENGYYKNGPVNGKYTKWVKNVMHKFQKDEGLHKNIEKDDRGEVEKHTKMRIKVKTCM
jgi:hypothetical protein